MAATTIERTSVDEPDVRRRVREDITRHVDWSQVIHEAAGGIIYVAPTERGPGYSGALWDNLRPSEAARLDELLNRAWDQAEPTMSKLLEDAITEAAMAFAREFPDAPRAIPGIGDGVLGVLP